MSSILRKRNLISKSRLRIGSAANANNGQVEASIDLKGLSGVNFC